MRKKRYSKKSIETLSDSYVISLLRKGSFGILKKEDIPEA